MGAADNIPPLMKPTEATRIAGLTIFFRKEYNSVILAITPLLRNSCIVHVIPKNKHKTVQLGVTERRRSL
jgi:hypothetical protein